MAEYEPPDEAGSDVSPRTLMWLERLDNMAHVIVAVIFILMAATVIIYTGVILARQVPLIATAVHGSAAEEQSSTTPVVEDPFFANSLLLLSSVLFAVILLELLRTIITYLKTRDIHAIMREFLVVGIISSVRKILLVGAQASLSGDKDAGNFIKEATGTVISIVGILLLIVGLIALQYSNKSGK